MQFKTLLVGIAAMGFAGAVNAATYTSNVNPSGSWASAGSWTWDGGGSPTNPPDGDDLVVIQAGDVITVGANAQVGRMQIASTGQLVIGAFTLTVDGADTAGSDGITDIDGELVLQNGSSVLLFDSATGATQTITGSGKIKGENATAKVRIAGSEQVTSQILIEGLLTIDAATGTATMVNSGSNAKIRANAAGNFTLAANLNVSDTSGVPSYEVTASGAQLKFMNANSGYTLLGDFVLAHCGATLFVADGVALMTDGDLTDGSSGSPLGYVDFEVDFSAVFAWDVDDTAPTPLEEDEDFCP